MFLKYILNELPKRYSYHFFAWLGIVFFFCVICTYLGIVNFSNSDDGIVILLTLIMLLDKIALLILFIFPLIFFKLVKKENKNPEFRIKNTFLSTNKIYAIILLLLCLITLFATYLILCAIFLPENYYKYPAFMTVTMLVYLIVVKTK